MLFPAQLPFPNTNFVVVLEFGFLVPFQRRLPVYTQQVSWLAGYLPVGWINAFVVTNHKISLYCYIMAEDMGQLAFFLATLGLEIAMTQTRLVSTPRGVKVILHKSKSVFLNLYCYPY